MAGRESCTGQYGELDESLSARATETSRASVRTLLSTLWLSALVVKSWISVAKTARATIKRLPYHSSKRRRSDRGLLLSYGGAFSLRMSLLTSRTMVPAYLLTCCVWRRTSERRAAPPGSFLEHVANPTHRVGLATCSPSASSLARR